jgi:hypothetical protein
VHGEVRGRSIVDRGGIDAEQRDIPLLDQQARSLRTVRRKVELARIGRMAEIGRRIGPMTGPVRPDQDPGAGFDTAVLRLERQHVFRRHAIVAVLRGLVADVDDDDGPDQPIERHKLQRLAVTREMDRRIEMRAAVLRHAERVGGVEESGGGVAEMQLLELEVRGRRRPEYRCGVVGMREINEAIALQVERLGRQLERQQAGAGENEGADFHVSSSQIHVSCARVGGCPTAHLSLGR